jgi:hypothetical protein
MDSILEPGNLYLDVILGQRTDPLSLAIKELQVSTEKIGQMLKEKEQKRASMLILTAPPVARVDVKS